MAHTKTTEDKKSKRKAVGKNVETRETRRKKSKESKESKTKREKSNGFVIIDRKDKQNDDTTRGRVAENSKPAPVSVFV